MTPHVRLPPWHRWTSQVSFPCSRMLSGVSQYIMSRTVCRDYSSQRVYQVRCSCAVEGRTVVMPGSEWSS